MKSINAVFCLLLFAWMFGCTDRSSPTYIATKSTEALCKGNVDEYLDYMYITNDDERDRLESRFSDGIDNVVAECEAKGGVVELEIFDEELSEDGRYYEVEFDAIFGNGEKVECIHGATLENIDGQWYVYNPLRKRNDE